MCVCVCVCMWTFKLVCGFGGNSARNGEAEFQGLRGSQSSAVRKFCFSLHQPICPHVCSASQTPLFPGIVMSVSDPILLSPLPK